MIRMKTLTWKWLLLLFLVGLPFAASAQGLKALKLRNGLSVYIWEDDTKSDVFGIVAVRTGSANDPAEYTGLAHYLEHVMFKGTDKIGALDWATEDPLYQQIIAKYDEMADATDRVTVRWMRVTNYVEFTSNSLLLQDIMGNGVTIPLVKKE